MTEQLIKAILTEELYGSSICESAEQFSDINYLYETLMLEKLLFGEPVTVPELRKILHNKIVNFEFIKLDGAVRPARGTTMMKYIPPADHPKGIRPSSPKVATFFDLTKDAWRSVSQKSREIVLKKDEETGKPVVVVQPKGKKPEEKPIEEPEVEVPEPEVEVPEVPPTPPVPEKPEKPEVEVPEEPGVEPEGELDKFKDELEKASTEAKKAIDKVEKAKSAWQKIKDMVGLGRPRPPQPFVPTAPPMPKQERSTILIPTEVRPDTKKPPIELPDEALPPDWKETNPFRLGATLRPFESFNPPKEKIVRESISFERYRDPKEALGLAPDWDDLKEGDILECKKSIYLNYQERFSREKEHITKYTSAIHTLIEKGTQIMIERVSWPRGRYGSIPLMQIDFKYLNPTEKQMKKNEGYPEMVDFIENYKKYFIIIKI